MKNIKDLIKYISNVRVAQVKPQLEGISFRYKTVQFHLIDDCFEEIERKPEIFGDVKIFSERFSLPGFGIVDPEMSGDEFQFEIVVRIDSKVSANVYYSEIEKVLEKISDKHDVEILIEPYDPKDLSEGDERKPLKNSQDIYNLHKIIYYTNKEDVFPKE
jgi:hypothetical protein